MGNKHSTQFFTLLLFLLTSSAWAAPNIQQWQTANGVKVLFVAAPDLPMVDIRMVFDAGSARDGDKPGISQMTNSLLVEGAGEWNADQIAERLESVGAEMSVGSLRDMAWVSVRTLTDEKPLERALETLTAVLAIPRFDDTALERNRQAMQAGLRLEEQNPGALAKKSFFKAVYGHHPYGIHSGGTSDSLAAITKADIQSHFGQFYVASNGVLAIVGALDRLQAELLAQRVTTGMQTGDKPSPLPEVDEPERAAEIHNSFPSSQSHILIGQPGIYRGDPDYFPLYVGNHIFGGSGLVSLLSGEVREKRGLSYSVYSYFSPMRRNGPFIMSAQTQNAKAKEALSVMRKTLQRFIEQGPTEQELTASKQNITGGFPLRIASNGKIIEYLAVLGFYDLPLDYLDTFIEKINAVTAVQIKDAFKRRVHPDRFVTLVLGGAYKEQTRKME